MDREQAKEEVRQKDPTFLQRAKQKVGGRPSYICPSCGNGSGSSGTGIALDPNSNPPRYHCFKCGLHEDIIGLWKLHTGTEEDAEAFKGLYEYYSIHIDSYTTEHTQQELHNMSYTTKEDPVAEVDYTDFFLQANKNIEQTDYHRGISLETLNRYKVGYVENWKHPKAPEDAPATPRLIIPISCHSYIARDTRPEIPEAQRQYAKSKAKGKDHPSWTFNRKALQSAQKPIYVTEGELDALSIIDAGGEAIAIGSAQNVRRFMEELEENPPAQPLIIYMDNDEAGEAAADKLQEALEAAQLPFYRQYVPLPYKDANEALQADRDAFKAVIAAGKEHPAEQAEEQARARQAAALELEREALESEAAAHALEDFRKAIENSKKTSRCPTGFPSVDDLLDGGLYAGLYVLGAITALGKTAFCLQLLDNIAAAGRSVIMFSLEMSRYELMARSISRLTFTEDAAINETTKNAKTVRGILAGERYSNYSQKEIALIDAAIAKYKGYGQRVYIYEGVGNIGVEQIRETVERHVRAGEAPVVLIDYLQILAPADIRATDKQNTDKNVLELKRLSRDLELPIIGISSFNRDNYTEPVNLTAFKESGAVEYSSDVLIGLQYEGMDYQSGEKDKERLQRVRDLLSAQATLAKEGKAQHIQVKILKNRNGAKGEAVLDYFPAFNFFRDPKEFKPVQEEWELLGSTEEDIPFN